MRPALRSRRAALALIALLALAVTGAACGGDDGGGAEGLPTIPPSQFEDLTDKTVVVVDAIDNAFEPRYIRIAPGTKVEFQNTGRNPHNVVPAEPDQFETVPTDRLQPGQTASLTFDEPGTYAYFCSLHGTATRGMNGRIEVVEG